LNFSNNGAQRPGLAAGWEFKAGQPHDDAHKGTKILFKTKSQLKNGQAPQQKIGGGLQLKKVGQAQLADKPMLVAVA